MIIKPLHKQIILIESKNIEELSNTFIRIQEYYESPFAEIRGKTFTLGRLAQLYSERGRTGGFTYHKTDIHWGDWAGFNFPSEALAPFIQGLFDPLTEKEAAFISTFRYRTDKFYIIGTIIGDTGTYKHELAHALYYISDKYKKEVDSLLLKVSLTPILDKLKETGYTSEVFLDESQAYLISDLDSLELNINQYPKYIELQAKLLKVFNKFTAKEEIQL